MQREHPLPVCLCETLPFQRKMYCVHISCSHVVTHGTLSRDLGEACTTRQVNLSAGMY